MYPWTIGRLCPYQQVYSPAQFMTPGFALLDDLPSVLPPVTKIMVQSIRVSNIILSVQNSQS